MSNNAACVRRKLCYNQFQSTQKFDYFKCTLATSAPFRQKILPDRPNSLTHSQGTNNWILLYGHSRIMYVMHYFIINEQGATYITSDKWQETSLFLDSYSVFFRPTSLEIESSWRRLSLCNSILIYGPIKGRTTHFFDEQTGRLVIIFSVTLNTAPISLKKYSKVTCVCNKFLKFIIRCYTTRFHSTQSS